MNVPDGHQTIRSLTSPGSVISRVRVDSDVLLLGEAGSVVAGLSGLELDGDSSGVTELVTGCSSGRDVCDCVGGIRVGTDDSVGPVLGGVAFSEHPAKIAKTIHPQTRTRNGTKISLLARRQTQNPSPITKPHLGTPARSLIHQPCLSTAAKFDSLSSSPNPAQSAFGKTWSRMELRSPSNWTGADMTWVWPKNERG